MVCASETPTRYKLCNSQTLTIFLQFEKTIRFLGVDHTRSYGISLLQCRYHTRALCVHSNQSFLKTYQPEYESDG